MILIVTSLEWSRDCIDLHYDDLNCLFTSLAVPNLPANNIRDHEVHLLTSVCSIFFNIKLHYICNKSIEKADNKRNYFNNCATPKGPESINWISVISKEDLLMETRFNHQSVLKILLDFGIHFWPIVRFRDQMFLFFFFSFSLTFVNI